MEEKQCPTIINANLSKNESEKNSTCIEVIQEGHRTDHSRLEGDQSNRFHAQDLDGGWTQTSGLTSMKTKSGHERSCQKRSREVIRRVSNISTIR